MEILPKWLSRRISNPSQAARIRDLEGTVDTQQRTLQGFESIVSAASEILTGTNLDGATADRHYTGNPYPSYKAKVQALNNMYDGTGYWGCDTAKTVVDVRAASIMGAGVQVRAAEGYENKADRELNFIREFIRYNNLGENTPQDWSTTVEIEGKWLGLLDPVTDYINSGSGLSGMIRVIHKPWSSFTYEITWDERDFSRFTHVHYTASKQQLSFDRSPDTFVYRPFAGRISQPDTTPTKTALVMRNIEGLDKAMWDWRKINHLYASPTPYFSFEDSDTAADFLGSAQYKNWRLGKGVVLGGGEFDLVCYKGEGYTTLKDEVMYQVRKISGATGVLPHFLGYPDLLSNRDTADNMVEGMILATTKERETWSGLYEELFQKAILLYNEMFNSNLNPMAITSEVPRISSARVAEIENVWLPMYSAGGISRETLLSQFTNIDGASENEKIREEKKSDAAAIPSDDPRDGGGRTPPNGGSNGARQNQAD